VGKDKDKTIEWSQVEQIEDIEDSEQNKNVEEVKVEDINLDQVRPKNLESNYAEYIPKKIADSLQSQIDKASKSILRSKLSMMQRKEQEEAQNKGELDLMEKYPWEESGLAYSLAFTGKAFDYLIRHDPKCEHPNSRQLLKKTAVLARVSPDGKAQLVGALQNQGSLVGMCGDGANDCVALKAADVGVSLSDAEASIAAPFTSKVPDISCIIKLLQEGRGALSTSFMCFKYMGMYSMIQFTSVSIMYTMQRNLTEYQFLFIDLILIIPLAFTMSFTRAATSLSREQPPGTLICLPVVLSMIGQLIIQAGAQVTKYKSIIPDRLEHFIMQPSKVGMRTLWKTKM
jgi:cation-transporting ATPase 13A3/4/5